MEENQTPQSQTEKDLIKIVRRPHSCDSIINAMIGAFSAGVAATIAVFKLFGKK